MKRSKLVEIDPVVKRFAEIPSPVLGSPLNSLADKGCIPYRQVAAKRALVASYETAAAEPSEAIKDVLADLRHLCDALGLDFAELDRTAYANYRDEKSA